MASRLMLFFLAGAMETGECLFSQNTFALSLQHLQEKLLISVLQTEE